MQAAGSSNGLDVFLCSISAETPVKLLQLRLCPHSLGHRSRGIDATYMRAVQDSATVSRIDGWRPRLLVRSDFAFNYGRRCTYTDAGTGQAYRHKQE